VSHDSRGGIPRGASIPLDACGRKTSIFYRDRRMHLNIKNDEAHRLARQLADLTGES
jgi:hypothetical protein